MKTFSLKAHALLCAICISAMFSSISMAAQAVATPESHVLDINKEAGQILNSELQKIKDLPLSQRAIVIARMGESLRSKPNAPTSKTLGTDPSLILKLEPQNLSLNQKLTLVDSMMGSIQLMQQVVVPSIGPVTPTQDGLRTAVQTLNQIAPRNPALPDGQLSPLLQQFRSIGRLIWTRQDLVDQGTPMWQLAGTVFVTSPGIVTTACHTLTGQGDQPLIDVVGTSVSLRAGLVLEVEFGATTELTKMYKVLSVSAISTKAGCDVAQLALENANEIPPLKVAAKSSNATRVVVVGYPQMSNYDPSFCTLGLGGITASEFCKFHNANPTVAKIGSPGRVLSSDDHDGVSVFTYDAPTDGGQSGSPVFNADTLEVIGIHYCCSGAAQNTSPLACATWHPQNISWNEAIASSTLVGDDLLKKNFSNVDPGQVATRQSLGHFESANLASR